MPNVPGRRVASILALGLLAVAPLARAADVDVMRAGAVGDGVAHDTAAIQRAIDVCSAGGGGAVRFPAGRFLTGTVQIKSGVTLRLEAGATLLGSTDPADYRNLDPFIDGTGRPLGHALVVAVDAERVGIEGPGTIDGQSPALKARQNPYAIRPFLVRFLRCADVTVRDVRLTNPGAWTLNFFGSTDLLIERVTIRSRGLGMPNNDGINIDSCERVRVRDCDVVSGDDALVIKSTSATRPTRDVLATGCRLSTQCNAIKLGTESIGGFERIEVADCRVTDTRMSGIALYTVDGGPLRDVRVRDIAMDGVTLPISVRRGARLKSFREGDAPRAAPGPLRDVSIQRVTARNVGMIGMLINGLPEFPVESLTISDVDIELPGGGNEEAARVELQERPAAYPEHNMFGRTMPVYGIYARHARGLRLERVRARLLAPDARPAFAYIDVEHAAEPDVTTRPATDAATRPAPPRDRVDGGAPALPSPAGAR